jgi:MFS family permease
MSASSEQRPSYLELLRTPGVTRLVVGAGIAGVGALGRGIAVLLYAREHAGSFAAAGLVLAAFSAGALFSGPLRGRQVDRVGFSNVLLPLGALSAAFSTAIVIAGELDASAVVLGALAAASGGTTPPVGPALRSLWSRMLGESGQLTAAYATTTMLNEIGFFGGPLLVGGIVAIASPGAALVIVSAALLAGTTLFATAPAAREAEVDAERSDMSPLRSAGVRTILLAGLGFGTCFGVLDVALPAFAIERGSVAAGGALLAALSPGIVLGGYLYGKRAGERDPAELLPILALVAALGLVPILLADSIAVLGALMVLAGAGFAPVTTCLLALIDTVAPRGTTVETTTWFTSTYLVGTVGGTAVTGFITEHSSAHDAFWLALGAAAVPAAVAWAWRGTLVRPGPEARVA